MKHFDIQDRMLIQACLSKRMSLSEIAKRLNKNKSSVSREISNHIVEKNGFIASPCLHKNKYFVCNCCPHKGLCNHNKRYYNFEEANSISKAVLSQSRSNSQMDPENIKIINDILLEEIRRLGQTLHHVYVANPIIKNLCSERTLRRMIYRNNFDVKAHELKKYVRFKHEYKISKKYQLKDIRVIIGRQFSDFVMFSNKNKRFNIVQYDSVIGKRDDKKAILTITFPKFEFQFGLLIKKSDPINVRTKIKKLFKKIGDENVKKIFPINLADNGIEFSFFNEIENNDSDEKICQTFFTNPYKATDKAECERYHEFIRYFYPKGKSLDSITQEDLDEIFSNINSYVRKKLNDKCPYDLVKNKFGEDFLNAINIKRIPLKKVKLK